jgi:hypothetical protein
VWKREQFHQLAAYYARLRDRFTFENKKITGVRLTSIPFGEHKMAEGDNRKGGKTINPRFLDGKGLSGRLDDKSRRRALADAVTSKDNPWFAAAFVNRVWGELMGQAFYMPIDDMGPQKEAVFPTVLPRLAASFRGTNYDTKAFLRSVLNSEAYQRQVRFGSAPDEHLMFAGSYPSRLRADALWNSLVGVLGQVGAGGAGGFRGKGPAFGRGGFGGFEGQFKAEFTFDPSSRPEDVEGSIAQALMLMNSKAVNDKIKANPGNLVAQVLKQTGKSEDAVRQLYVRTLSRAPSERELRRCLDHISATTTRAEALEDILWALLNSAEFQTKR